MSKNINQNEDKQKIKEEIKEEIKALIEANPSAVEEAAERIAPDFDYETEGKALAMEEEYGPLPPAEVSPSKYETGGYKPKTKLGKFMFRDKHRTVMSVCMLVLLVITSMSIYKWITVYSKAVDTKAEIYGETVEFTLIPGTVKENLEYNKVSYDGNDEIYPKLNKKVNSKTQIKVDEVHYTSEVKKEDVPHIDYVMLDPDIPSGSKKVTEGNDGSGYFSYKTKLVNGKPVAVQRELKEWIVQANDGVLHLGTARTGHTGRYKVTSTFTANCSAYWMGNSAYGAGGGHCVYGTVAVDPSKYPYGTLFWIEGYGFAVANDCGGSIKGDKLDLWMDSYEESCAWGRRWMTSYVIIPAE